MGESKAVFKDYLVMRLWGRASEGAEVCILTTRRYLLTRHYRDDLRQGVRKEDRSRYEKVPGLRRYKTYKRADEKAQKMNKVFKTKGFSAIREDEI